MGKSSSKIMRLTVVRLIIFLAMYSVYCQKSLFSVSVHISKQNTDKNGTKVYSNPINSGNLGNTNNLQISQLGTVVWKFSVGFATKTAPAIGNIDSDSKLEVIFQANTHFVYALDDDTEALKWSYYTGSSGWFSASSPTLGVLDSDGNLEIAVGSDSGWLYGINGENGALLWKQKVSSDADSTPVIADVNNDGKLDAIMGGDSLYSGAAVSLFVFNGKNGPCSGPIPWGLEQQRPAHLQYEMLTTMDTLRYLLGCLGLQMKNFSALMAETVL